MNTHAEEHEENGVLRKGLVIKEDSGHSCSCVVHSQSYLISPLLLLLLPYYYRPCSKHEIHRSNLCHSLELGNCRVGKTNPIRFNPTLYSSLNSSHHSHLIYMGLTCLKSTLTCRAAMRSESIPRRCLRQPWRSGRRSAVLSGMFTTQIIDCPPPLLLLTLLTPLFPVGQMYGKQ